ncbi:Transglycosylase [Hyphomicrobium sp. 1Nfss2.1]|uniref:transglycosylase n=1 Tax=Hyphomicrobium sp. 1Nfss2.1 TaxID=3413936 RepID=UPI003C7DBCD3
MGAIGTFLLLVIFGAAIGFALNRHGRGWLGRQVTAATGAGDVTYALVGIAGSFMGFHIAAILGLLSPLLMYLVAVAGAALTVWLWRG